MFPRVSVIIPAYNAEKTIENLIRTMSNQTFSKEKSEIIVVNDCSSDKTLEILKRLEQDFPIRILSHEFNKGLSAARNTGIKNSHGKILIFIDADMTVDENYIENHVNFHNNKHVIGIVGNITAGENVLMDKYQKYLYKSRRGFKKFNPKFPLPYYTFLFNNTSIKREAIDNCGMFDENIKIYGGEDTEFAFRVSQKYPKNLFYCNAATAVHNHYRNFDDTLKNITTFAKTNVPYIVKKHLEMAEIYGIKYISSDAVGSLPYHRIVGKIIGLHSFFYLSKLLYNLLPFPMSIPFTRTTMAAKMIQGMKKGLAK